MNEKQQRKIDSLLRVQDFLDANADHVGALKDSEARKQLDDAVRALAIHGGDQAGTDLAMAGQISRQRALAARAMRPGRSRQRSPNAPTPKCAVSARRQAFTRSC